jgi:hypothetical protein
MSFYKSYVSKVKHVNPSFAIALEFCYFADLYWRKVLISVCQVGQGGYDVLL